MDTHTPSSGVKRGVIGFFFLSCADLFWELTREARLLDQLKENHRLAFRKSCEKFYIWGTGFNPERGELDEILNLSASLKQQTVSLLAKIAVILCSDENGLFYPLNEVAIPEILKHQRQRVLTLFDSLEANTPDPSEDSDNESSISGDSNIEFFIDTVLGDLQTFVECLVSLGFSLQRPACDPNPWRGKTAGPPPPTTGSAADMRLLEMPSAENLSPVLLPELVANFKEKSLPWADADDRLPFENPLQLIAGTDLPTIERDIALFFEYELKVVSKQRSLPPDWPSKHQVQALVMIATPLLNPAATACRYIGDKRGNPKKRLEVLLQYQKANQVTRLDRMYLPILENLFDEGELDKERRTSEFREIVGSIIVLEIPISIVSLAHLLNIPKDTISYGLDLLHFVLSIPVDENIPVKLIDSSFRDFLLDPHKRGKSPFWVDEKEMHKSLASKCLRLLSSASGLRQNMCNLTSPGTLKSEVNDHMIGEALTLDVQYACRYWVHHLQKSGGIIRDEDLVDVFLRKYFIYWLEAMSLLGEVSASILMVNSLQSLTKVDGRTPISDFLLDGKRFVQRNQSIIEDAPLQIYSSALIFAPEQSIIRKTFNDLIPTRVNRLPKVQKYWTSLPQILDRQLWPSCLVFSPNGQLLAFSSIDNEVLLWDVAEGSRRLTLPGNYGTHVESIAFSPDGQLLASATNDHTVRLWDTATGSCRSSLENCSISEKSGSSLLNHYSESEILGSSLFDHYSESEKLGSSLAFSPDGKLLASASSDQTVRLWDTATGSPLSILNCHSKCVNAIAFSPDGHLLASPWKDYSIRLWDSATWSGHITLQGHSNPVEVLAFSPDGQMLASGSDDYTVRLWDAATGSCRYKLNEHESIISAVVFSPDGKLLASASDQTVQLWDTATGSPLSIFECRSQSVKAIAFSPDGHLLASPWKNISVRLWDAATGSCHITLQGHSNSVKVLAFSPDGQLLASGSSDYTVRLWDAATVTCCSTLEGHSESVNAVVFSLDGQLVASASYDGTVRLWDASTGSCRSKLGGHSRSVNAVAFSPDGQLLASASDDHTVRLWDAATGSCLSTLEGHSRYVNAVAFSLNGQLLASASADHTVRLWDAATGSCLNTLEGHSRSVEAVAFSPDSKLLASASWDHMVRLSYAATGSCLSTLSLDKLIRTLSFSSDFSYLKTDIGNISILKTDRGDTSYSLSFSDTPGFEIDEWVACKGQRFLWLPHEYRPKCTAVFGNIICLGHASGNVTILGFDFSSISLRKEPMLSSL